jgi:WD40 repeat protein
MDKEFLEHLLPQYRGWVVAGLHYSPDGKTVAVRGIPDLAYICDVSTGKELFHVQGHKGSVCAIAYSPDGKTLATATNSAVQLWDADKGKLLRRFAEGNTNGVQVLAFAPGGKVLAWGTWDKIHLTEVAVGKPLRTLEAVGMETIGGLAFTPDGKTLISASQDGKVRFWDVPTLKERLQLNAKMVPIGTLALTRDGKTVAVGSWVNSLRLWDAATGKELFQDFRGHAGSVLTVAYAPDGKILASGGDAQDDVILWDASTGQPLRQLPVYRPRHVLFSPDGRALLTNGFSNFMQIWDVATGKELFKLRKAQPEVATSIALSPDGRTLISGHSKLAVWDPATGKLLRELPLSSAYPPSMAFAPDGSTVAVGTAGGAVHLWNLRAGRENLVLRGHEQGVRSVAFSPDGAALLSGSLDQTVCLWEIATGKEVFRFRHPGREVTCVAFSPDGTILASSGNSVGPDRASGASNKILLWDARTGKELHQIRERGTHVAALSFSPDGTWLAAGLQDTTVLVWDTAPFHRVGVVPVQELAGTMLEALWADLAGEDAGQGYRAVWAMAAARHQGVAFLRERLKPAAGVPPGHIRQLISDLDHARFAVRTAASKRLETLGEVAEPAIQRALAESPALEVRKRLEALLANPRVVRSAERVRTLRAIQVLEQIGSQDARNVLLILAGGAADARETQVARASLQRLSRRAAR